MTALDREKARTVLARAALIDMSNDEVLDALEQEAAQERSGFNRADTDPALTLTAGEARVVTWALRHVKGWPDGLGPEVTLELLRERPALAARLEAATS